MELIEWEDYQNDIFPDSVFHDASNYNMSNRSHYTLSRTKMKNLNRSFSDDRSNRIRFQKHEYESIPEEFEFQRGGSADFDSCDEEGPLCRRPLSDVAVLGYPSCFNRSFRVVERRLFYYYR